MTADPKSEQSRSLPGCKVLCGWIERIRSARSAQGNGYIVGSILALAILSGLFAAFPEIDIAMSRAFYRDDDTGFWLHYDPFIEFVRIFGQSIILAILLATTAIFLIRIGPWGHLLPRGANAKASLYLILAALIGPGLIINMVLKANWDRARPVETDIFGGEYPFAAAWTGISQCACNSFASGEAALAFWPLAFVPLLQPHWRFVSALALIGFAVLISSMRVITGAHYVSDVAIGGAITLVAIAVAYRVFLGPARLASGDDLRSPTHKNASRF